MTKAELESKVKTLEARVRVLTQELEEIGYEPPAEDPDPPICRVCLHTIRHEPICNDCARKMCRQCGGTDHLACISVKDNPTTTWTLTPMRCAGCGSTTGFLNLRDGQFFCEKC